MTENAPTRTKAAPLDYAIINKRCAEAGDKIGVEFSVVRRVGEGHDLQYEDAEGVVRMAAKGLTREGIMIWLDGALFTAQLG